jgi:signal peptidase I, archaeal type
MDHDHAVDLAIEHQSGFDAPQPPQATAVQLSRARSRTEPVTEAVELPGASAWQRTLGVRRLLLDVLVVALIVVLMYAFWPARLGGTTSYVIVKGTSMEPKFHTGDLAIVRAQDHYRGGDIVAYRIPKGNPAAGSMVIHRIIGFAHGGYLMQGDNRTTPDAWHPTAHDVVGRYRMLVPLPGIQFWALIPWIFAGLIGIGVMWILWPRSIEEPGDDRGDGTDDEGTASAIETPVILGQRRLRRLEREAQQAEARGRRRKPRRTSQPVLTGLTALVLVVLALAIAA